VPDLIEYIPMDGNVPEYDSEIEKYCSGCDDILPLTEFHRDRTHNDGYKSHCKSCRSGRKKSGIDSKPIDKELRNKTKEELETIARSRAIKRVLDNHWNEFQGLISRYRGEVGLPTEWREVSN